MSAPPRQHAIRRPSVAAVVGAWWCLVASSATAADVDFYGDVYPILKSNCVACHNKTTTKAALNLETPEAMRKGGDSGEGLIPGNGEESLIYQAAAHTGDVEMPPKGNKSGASDLTPKELALLKAWIDQGARGSGKPARQVVWQPVPPGVHPIYSVAMTRDGRLAACGRANQVFVYDLATRWLAARLADESLDQPGSPRGQGAAHRAFVQSLAFSPDGTRLASGGFREVKIWRREDAPAARRDAPAPDAVASVLSADGRRLVYADRQGTLHVLEAATGKALRTVPTGDLGALALLSLSPDAGTVAAYGADGTLGLWSLAEDRLVARREGLAGVQTLSWTRDGRAIATGGDDGGVRLWSLPAGEEPGLVLSKQLEGAAGAVAAIETGANLLIAASADGKVRLWSLPEGKSVRELAVGGVVALGLSGDGRRLAAGRGDGVVQVWDLAAGKPVVELTGDAETGAHLAALDGIVAAEGLEMAFQKQEAARLEAQDKALDGLLKKANETVATVRKDLAEKQDALKQATDAKEAAKRAADAIADQVAKAPDGKPDAALEKSHKDARDKLMAATLAEASALSALRAREIHLKDAEAEGRNYSAAQARNEAAVAAAGAAAAKAKAAQDRAKADAAETRKAAAARKLRPLDVRFSADDQAVAAAFSDGSLRVWAVASGLPIGHVPGRGSTAAASLAAGAEGVFAACTEEGSTARVGTASRWVLERTLGGETTDSPFADRVNALRFSPDGQTLAAGGGEPTRSGDISLWDVADGRRIGEWKERHADAVLCLDFSPDGRRLASGGADKIARVTDLATGRVVHAFEGHTHHVLGVSFRADGRVLATAGADGVVVVWDMLSGERKRKIEGWSKEVTSLQFLGVTNQILTSAGNNLVRIVDDAGAQVRAMPGLPDFMQSAAGSASAGLIVGGGEDGRLRVWSGTTGQELAAFGADPDSKAP